MRQLREVKINDIIFIEIKTVRIVEDLIEGTPLFESWKHKINRGLEREDLDYNSIFKARADFYPEFAKVVCITVGRIKDENRIILKTYCDEDEKSLLEKFTKDLNKVCKMRPKSVLCGHSIVRFDIPFIFKRCIINQVFPNLLIDVSGLKPWEVTAIDTQILWRSSSGNMTSLISMAVALGVKCERNQIIGCEVGLIYYNEGTEGLVKVCNHCESDIISQINSVRVMRFEDQIKDIEVQDIEEDVPENLFDRISTTGLITEEDKAEIFEKASGLDYKEKEKFIKILKAALILNKANLPEELELQILSR